MRCNVCDSLDEGRIYQQQRDSRDRGPDELTVNLDVNRHEAFYATSFRGTRGVERVLALSEDIRAGMQVRFPGVTAIEFVDDRDSLQENSTLFTVRLPTENALAVETVEQAKRAMSSVIEEVVRTHGLRADRDTLGSRHGPALRGRVRMTVT